MYRKFLIICTNLLLVLGLRTVSVYGEGTPQLRKTVSDSAMIKLINTVSGVASTSFALYQDTSKTQFKMYVHVCALTEKVHMGFNLGTDIDFNVSATVIAPDGSIAFPLTVLPKTAGPGYIATYNRAVAGPVAAGGYTPFTFTPRLVGDYSIEFKINKLPSTGSSGGRGNTFIKYFDVSVTNAANVIQTGRLWSKAWNITLGSLTNPFNGTFYVYTSDRIVSKVTMNQMMPFEFIFSANKTGVKNTGNPLEDRKSVKGNTTYPSYPVFLNNPDINCYPTGVFGNILKLPSISGCPGNYCLNVEASAAGSGSMYLELNGVPGFQTGTRDRVFLQNLAAGNNCISWDGKDGLGNVVSSASVAFKLDYQNGITHIPMFDVEKNENGFSVEYVRPVSENGKPIGLFWDDSNVGGTISTTPCTGLCHSWSGVNAGNIGDVNSINTWWIGADTSITGNFSLQREVFANKFSSGKGRSNDTSICASLKIINLNGKSIGVPGVKWRVITGSGTITSDVSLATNYTLSVADAARPFIQLELSSAGDGCIAVKDSIKYNILALPKVTALPKDPYTCAGSSFTLNGGGASTYTWDNGILNNVPFTINTSKRYTVTGTDIKGCRDTASTLVRVNIRPDLKLSVKGDTICTLPANNNPVVTLRNAQAGVTYSTRLGSAGGPVLGTSTPAASGNLVIPVNRSLLSPAGNHPVFITAFLTGCGTSVLDSTANIRINQLPDNSLPVSATGPVCLGSSAEISVGNTSSEVTYNLFDKNAVLTASKNGTSQVLKFTVTPPSVGLHDYYLEAQIKGCATQRLLNKASVTVNDGPGNKLRVTETTPVCLGQDAVITVDSTDLVSTYQVWESNRFVSSVQTGNGASLSFNVKDLNVGLHKLTVKVTTPGCGLISLLDTAFVTVNGNPILNLPVKGDTICTLPANNNPVVTIRNAQAGVTYSTRLGSAGGPVLGTSTPAASGNLVIPVNRSLLSPAGNHPVFITAFLTGCGTSVLDSTANIRINQLPDNSLPVSATGPVCLGSSAEISVGNTSSEVTYNLFDKNAVLTASKNGTSQVLKFTVTPPSVGLHDYYLEAQIKGCATQRLLNKASVTVNDGPGNKLRVTETTPVCLGQDAVITVDSTDLVSTYQVWESNRFVSSVQTGNGASLSFNVKDLNVGLHKLTVKVTTPGCGLISLLDTAFVTVNGPPAVSSVMVEGSSVCPGQSAIAILTKTETGISYNLFINGENTGLSISGTGKTDSITVPSGLLVNEMNEIRFTAGISACNIANVLDTDTIFNLSKAGLQLFGDNLLCFSDTGNYQTNGTPGALSYLWETGADARILSGQGSRNITALFDSISSSVSVMPVGTYGACRTLSVDMSVIIKAPVTGNAFIHGRDTLCVGQTDTIKVSRQYGVSYYRWIFPPSVILMDTIVTDSASQKIVVRYTQAGFQSVTAVPFSECARKFGEEVTKKVRILGIPVAEANEYSPGEMIGNIEGIPLNGQGSTLTGAGIQDTIRYYWYTEQNLKSFINNPRSLTSASLTTTAKEAKVYLKVTNTGGYCQVTDSAVIQILFDIDIPNVFSPNNDGTHDTWEIKHISTFYPSAQVEVYNKWGSLIWRSAPGYTEAWDGKRNGEELPVATYYFVLDKKNGSKPRVGPVTILR